MELVGGSDGAVLGTEGHGDVVVKVDILGGEALYVGGSDGLDHLAVVGHLVVAALVEHVGALDDAGPPAVVLDALVVLDDELFLNLVEGLLVATLLHVLLEDGDAVFLDFLGLLGVEADVELPVHGAFAGEGDAGAGAAAGAVGVAVLLADDFSDGDAEAFAELLDGHAGLGVEFGARDFHLAGHDEHALLLDALLHLGVLDAGGELGAAVDEVVLGDGGDGGQVVEVVGDHGDVAVADVTDEEEGLVVGEGEALLVDLEHAVEAEAAHFLLAGEDDLAFVVGVGGAVVFLDEGILGVVGDVFELLDGVLDLALVGLLVLAGGGVVEVDELEGGLEVLGGAVAVEALGGAADVGADGEVHAFEFLAELDGAEVGDAAFVNEGVGVLGLVAVLVTIERGAAEGEGGDEDFVGFEFGFLHHEADAVGAHVLGVAEDGVAGGLDGGDGLDGLTEEGLVVEVVNPGFGGHILAVLEDVEDFLLGGHVDAVLLGGGEVEDEVLVGDPGLNHGVALVEGDFGEEFLGIFPFLADAGAGFVLEVVVGVLVGEAVGLSFVLFLGHLGVVAEEFFFLALEFGQQEAVVGHLLDGLEEGFGGLVDAVLLGSGAEGEDVDFTAEEAAVAAAGIHHGGGGFLGELVEALVDHHADEAADEHGAVGADGAVDTFLVFPVEGEAGVGGLLVGGDADEGFDVVGDLIALALQLLGAEELVAAEGVFDLLLHGLGAFEAGILVVVHVANDDDGLQVGAVPVVEEVDDGLALEVHDDFFLTDGETVGIEGAFEHDGPGLLAETVAVADATAPLLVDDAALFLNLLLVEEDVAGPAVEDFDTHLDHLGVVGGDVDIVDSLVEGGVGVDVASELHAVLLQLVDHLVAWIALDAVEGHVLAEVGETLLVVAFHDRTGVGDQAELDHLLGFLVVADVVGESVVQLAVGHLFVEGHLGFQVTFFLFLVSAGELGERGAANQSGQQQNPN